MTPKSAKRILRILELRKMKIEEDVARISTGMTAGQSLRERLEEAAPSPRFVDFTVRNMTKTVSIIDRGLAVLSEQKRTTLLELERVKTRQGLLQRRAAEAAERTERQTSEDELSEWLATTRSP